MPPYLELQLKIIDYFKKTRKRTWTPKEILDQLWQFEVLFLREYHTTEKDFMETESWRKHAAGK